MFRLLRGVLLIVIGIIIAVIVLANNLDEADDSPSTSTTTTAADSDTTPATTIPAGTPETTAPPVAPTTTAAPAIPTPTTHAPAQTRVQVFNSTDVSGAAGRLTTSLNAQGYVTLPPANSNTDAYAASLVYFTTSEYLPDAQAVAGIIGLATAGSIQLIPNPSPVTHDQAHVVVIIGTDGLASG